MKALIGIFAASVMLVSGSAIAADTGWYVGGGVGSTQFEAEDLKDRSTGFTLIGGYQVNPYFAWEGELLYSGEASEDYKIGGASGEAKIKYNNIAAGLVGSIPFAKRFAIFGRAQATVGKLKIRNSFDGESHSESSRDLGYIVGVGASVQFGPVDLRLRYDVQRVEFNGYSVDKPERIGLDALWRF